MVTDSVADNRTALIIDQHPESRGRLATLLSEAGYAVSRVEQLDTARDLLVRRHHDAVVLDLARAAEIGEAVRVLRQIAPGTATLVLVDPDDRDEAVRALRHGADDYLLRPPDSFDLTTRLGRILERYELDSRVASLKDELTREYGLKKPVGRSPAMRKALDRVMRVAPMRTTVLIYGESGVGKELIARAIHFNSPRRDGPFIALNCAAIAPSLIESELFGHERGSFTGAHARARGKFELAHRGTLFLDEIGEMDPATQVKVLRVLEEREFMRVGGDRSVRVDVRVIAATNADLEKRVLENAFRQDLYYRLKVVTITVPSLRERRSDIAALVETFVEELSKANAVPRRAVTPEAMAALQSYAWPGNVRELKNLVESVLVSVPGVVIRLEDLPSSIRGAAAGAERNEVEPGTTLAEMERDLIRRTLEHTGGNRTHTASLLGIGVRTLQRKIQAYEIDVPPRRRRPRRRRTGVS
ncbi:MAG: sigma-54 dependent transcriptional regulator [Acidobacteriota bacterium]|nr:sigma-54 dependent transcriptional regulator [Acidobacteriota bacterium]